MHSRCLNRIRRGECAGALGAVCACALLGGCGESATEAPAPTPAAEAAVAPATPAGPTTPEVNNAVADAGAPLEPTLAVAQSGVPALADGEAGAGEYKPPFPDRVELFVTPKRSGGPSSAGGQTESVQLGGFVNVDRPRAVLTIDGQVIPLAEGESQNGVEVISIQPPKVILQRGRQRWQASLE